MCCEWKWNGYYASFYKIRSSHKSNQIETFSRLYEFEVYSYLRHSESEIGS